jgi:hypothetical protein
MMLQVMNLVWIVLIALTTWVVNMQSNLERQKVIDGKRYT